MTVASDGRAALEAAGRTHPDIALDVDLPPGSSPAPAPGAPRYLLTEAGMGYRFSPDGRP